MKKAKVSEFNTASEEEINFFGKPGFEFQVSLQSMISLSHEEIGDASGDELFAFEQFNNQL
jgi:hypothetical protein